MRISKFTLPALTVAGALALAACGGGGGTTTVVDDNDNDDDDPVTLASATTAINACATAACVDGVVEGAEGDLTAAQLATLGATADARKAAIAAGTPLSGGDVAAANQLADALAGSEALQLGSRHIDLSIAEPRGNVPWTRLDGKPLQSVANGQRIAGLPGGWEGKAWKEPNPEGSSGEEQDMRAWTENPKHISEKYEEFFKAANHTARGISNIVAADATGEGTLTLADANGFNSDQKAALPSNFFTSGWTRNKGNTPDTFTDDTWELRGSFYGVPGKFVCPQAGVGTCFEGDPPADTVNVSKPIDAGTSASPVDLSSASITFVPSNFDADETDVPALFAKKANPDFLSFGVYWTTVIDDEDRVTALRVDPFAGGGEKYTATESIVLTGTGNLTANYSGSAAGTYVRTIVNDDNDREATGYGGFSASANLKAVFGTSKDTLTGTISDFKLRDDQASAGAAPNSSWEVSLKGDINAGVVDNNSGGFHAQFHGDLRRNKAGDEVRQSNGHGYAPYGLVGTFEHSFSDRSGHVAGAFGAECDGGNCVQN